jgi:hypothetical protein
MLGASEIVRIRRQLEQLADELARAVALARAQGASWDDVARLVSVPHPAGPSYARSIAALFPGGTSATTLRRLYGGAE